MVDVKCDVLHTSSRERGEVVIMVQAKALAARQSSTKITATVENLKKNPLLRSGVSGLEKKKFLYILGEKHGLQLESLRGMLPAFNVKRVQ
jgi:hypothetical protein